MYDELDSSRTNTSVGFTRSINLSRWLISTWVRNAIENYPDRRRYYGFSCDFDKMKCTQNKKFVRIICYTVYDLVQFSEKNINPIYVSFHMW